MMITLEETSMKNSRIVSFQAFYGRRKKDYYIDNNLFLVNLF